MPKPPTSTDPDGGPSSADPVQPPTGRQSPGLRARFGLPDVSGHRRFVVAMGVDAIGSGVFMPLSVLYFVTTTAVPLAQVGLAMSLAGAIAFPFVLVVGHLVDRFGAKQLLLLGNALQAVAFGAFVFADTFGSVLGVLALASLGQATFWGSYSPTVAAVSAPGEREMWFGFLGALRNVGFAVGGIVAGVAVAIGTTMAFDVSVLANAASYVVAFSLLLGVHPQTSPGGTSEADGGWGRVLRDGDFLLVVLANLSYALCCLALNIAMPIYVSQLLDLPGWVVGAVYVVNTVLVGFGQSPMVRAMTGHRRWRIVVAGQVFFLVGFVAMAALGGLPVALAVPAVLAAVAIYTIGEILAGPVLTAIAVESRPAALRGRYMSLYQLSWTAASVIAPAAYTWLLDRGPWPVWVVLIIVSAAGAALAPLLARRFPIAAARVTNASAAEA